VGTKQYSTIQYTTVQQQDDITQDGKPSPASLTQNQLRFFHSCSTVPLRMRSKEVSVGQRRRSFFSHTQQVINKPLLCPTESMTALLCVSYHYMKQCFRYRVGVSSLATPRDVSTFTSILFTNPLSRKFFFTHARKSTAVHEFN
jgi:hypothetical protein